MALNFNARSRISPFTKTHFFSIYYSYALHLPATNTNTNTNRCLYSQQAVIQNDKLNKPSTKTKRAKSMARLANSNPWSIQLESSLSLLAPSLSKTTVLQTLQLIRTPDKAFRFFNWVQKVGFSHNHQTFFLMLEILGKDRKLNVARNFLFSIEKRSEGCVKLEDKFFNSLIRSYGNAGLFQESIRLFETMKTTGVLPSAVTFNSLLMILLKRGRTNMAHTLFDEMLNTYGVKPDGYTFNILIRGFCKNSMVETGFRYFKEMERFKCHPDAITYNTIVDGLCRVGKVRIAHNVVKGMSKKSTNLHPNVVTYTTLLRGYCMKQEIDEAMVVFNEMLSLGLKPNAITYNTFIKGLCEAQRYDKIKEILEGVTKIGSFTPDTCTLNTLIHARCSSGHLDEALDFFEKMLDLQVPPDSATYSILIRCLCERGNFDKAEELFDKLSDKELLVDSVGCIPLVAAYNPMFEHLCANGKTKKAERVFRQLMRRGTQDPISYKTLIMGHCREGTFEAGYELLVLMLRRYFVPGFEIYESLINGLLHKGEPLLAHKTLEKMLKSSHQPETSTFHSILETLIKKSFPNESFSLVMLMLDKNIRLNITLSTDTVRLLFERGLRSKALQIVGSLYKHGYMIEMKDLIGFLCKNRKLFEAYEMILFCLEKNQIVDNDLCDMVICGLCKRKRISDAFVLYYELADRGKHQQLCCLEDLRIALEADGKSEEAEFVAKRMSQEQHRDMSPC